MRISSIKNEIPTKNKNFTKQIKSKELYDPVYTAQKKRATKIVIYLSLIGFAATVLWIFTEVKKINVAKLLSSFFKNK